MHLYLISRVNFFIQKLHSHGIICYVPKVQYFHRMENQKTNEGQEGDCLQHMGMGPLDILQHGNNRMDYGVAFALKGEEDDMIWSAGMGPAGI